MKKIIILIVIILFIGAAWYFYSGQGLQQTAEEDISERIFELDLIDDSPIDPVIVPDIDVPLDDVGTLHVSGPDVPASDGGVDIDITPPTVEVE